MSSDFRIDPSTTSTHLDYGQNSDSGSQHQGDGSSNKDQQSKTYLGHQSDTLEDDAPRLKARKTRKKKTKKKTKKKRKIAERNARQNRDDNPS